MIDDTKTIWQCPACHKDGCVQHKAGESALMIVDLVVKDHDAVSPLCTLPFDQLQVKWFD